VCLSCCCATLAQAQPTQQDRTDSRTALIVGQVIDASSARPVADAIVTLTNGESPAAPIVTNIPGVPPLAHIMTGSDGQFAFRALSKGSYGLTALKPGYVTGAYGRRRPDGPSQQVTLEDGQKVGDVAIAIWKYATISGAVVDEAGEPVIGVQVRTLRRTYVAGRPRFVPVIGSSPATPFGVNTDDRGTYRVSGLSPGDYVVVVESMQASVPLSTIQAYGDPGTMPASQLSQIFQIRGPTQLPGTSPSSIQIGNTLMSLSRPGLIPPQPAAGRVFIYPTTYYPSALTIARATVVRVASGQERSAVDFQLSPVAASRVSGALAGDSAAVSHVPLWLNAPDAQESGVGLDSAAATITDGNGAFVFPAVPAGEYILRALKQPPRPSSSGATTMIQAGAGVVFSTVMSGSDANAPIPPEATLYAITALSVGRRDVNGLAIPLQIGPRVSGRLEFDGNTPRPTPQELERVTVTLEGAVPGAGSGLPPGRSDASGAFTTYSVPAGKYFVRASGVPRGWTFRAATYNGRDVSESVLDLEGADVTGVVLSFTDRPTQISGSVQSSDGKVDRDATVLLFPSDPQSWTNPGQQRRFRTARTTKTGEFTTVGLPAGLYYAVAVPDAAIGEWTEPATLERLARLASEIRLEESEKKSEALRTTEIR